MVVETPPNEPGRVAPVRGVVIAVCRVHALIPRANGTAMTAIDKRPVSGPVPLAPLGLERDMQVDRRHHGGVDQAVYAYGDEDAGYWEDVLGRPVPAGFFGENVRLRGIPVSGAVIGEQWSLGSAELMVTQPRTPCATFAEWVGVDDWINRFTAANRPGAYLRVVRAGVVQAGDAVAVTRRPAHGVTIADWFAAKSAPRGRPAALAAIGQRLLAAHTAGDVELSAKIHARAEAAIARAARAID